MKKFLFASAMALIGLSLASGLASRAQNAGTISIQDPAEFNAYQNASTQTSPAAKASAEESFLTAYPQSVAKKAVLDDLIGTYQQLNDPDKALSAASRLLQIDPNNTKALFMSVYIKKSQCGRTSDPQTCDDAAALAQKGLGLPKPADTSDADWKKLTDGMYPVYDSTIALDDMVSKKDDKAAIDEYKKELMLYPADQTTSGPALVDTLQLAQAYSKPDARDEVAACWFYARAWNFAPAAYKAQIEPQLEFWYKRFHGGLDGLDAVKTASAGSLFPPANFKIAPAPTPPEIVHNVIATTPDLKTLNLEDKEFVLANGTPDDQQKLWSVLQGQQTPVPGVVIDATATVLNISVTTVKSVKPQDFTVKLTTPAACSAVPPAPSELRAKEAQDYVTANAVQADTAQLGDLLTAAPGTIRKFSVEPAVAVIKVAVTQDAKDNKVADFIVNMKTPVGCKEAPAAGVEMKLQPADELDATYSTYTPTPAKAGQLASAQIVLNDGFIQAAAKAAPVRHVAPKPSAGHRPAGM